MNSYLVFPFCLIVLFSCKVLSAQSDTDNDGLPDAWEMANGLDENDPTDAFGDLDCDQVYNLYEFQLGSDLNDDNSPSFIYINPNVTEQQLQSLFNSVDINAPLLLRMEEGTYSISLNWDNYSNVPARFMMQGGWSSCMEGYDPFAFRTILESGEMFLLKRWSAFVVDGLEFNGTAYVTEHLGGYLSASNCAFYGIPSTSNATPFWMRPLSGSFEFTMANCSAVEQGRPLTIETRDVSFKVKARIINSTLTGSNFTSATMQYIPRWNDGLTDYYIKDCNLWDGPVQAINLGFGNSVAGICNIYAENSNMSGVQRGGVLGVTEYEPDVTYIDPIYDNRVAPYYELSPGSPLQALSANHGLYENDFVAAIGHNQNIVSCFVTPPPLEYLGRITDSDCSVTGEPNGSIEMVVTGGVPPYTFQWSTNDGVVSQSAMNQSNLSAGQYSVTITDAVFCTLQDAYEVEELNPQDCPSDCDLTLEDSDEDGMPNAWEIASGLDPNDATDALGDADCDNILNLFEHMLCTDPNDAASPVKTPFRPGDAGTINDQFVRAESEVVVLQLHEGEYEFDLYSNSNLMAKKFMIQGGWNEDFTHYDPSCQPTIIKYEQIFMDIQAISIEGEVSIVLDGIEVSPLMDNRTIAFRTRGFYYDDDGVFRMGINNCSFRENTTAFILDMYVNPWAYPGGGRLNLHAFNTTFADNGYTIFFTHSGDDKLSTFDFVNCVLTNSTEALQLNTTVSPIVSNRAGPTRIRVSNSILWDDIHPNSLLAYNPLDIDLKIENSLFRVTDPGQFGVYSATNTFDVDPGLILDGAHYYLPLGSPFLGAGAESGVPYEYNYDNPHIGINKNVIRLDSIILTPPDCDLDYGQLEIFRACDVPLEYSTDGLTFNTVAPFNRLESEKFELTIRSLCGTELYKSEVDFTGVEATAISFLETKANCGEMNGVIEMIVPQDWVGYEYALGDTTSFQTSTVFDSLSPNIYLAYIKTPEGCVKNIDFVILNSEREVELEATNVVPTSCGKANGELEFSVTNALGTPTFSINGSSAVSDLSYTNLSAGSYDILVEDDEGCQDTLTVTIDASEGIAFTDTLITPPTCGLDNGSISLSTNDIGVNTSLTLNGQPSDLNNINLPSGTYNFMITDDAGCVDSTVLTLPVSEPVAIISLDTTGTSCALPNGSVSLTQATGAPTEYSYNGVDYFTEPSFSNLPEGNYSLYAQNENCSDTLAFIIAGSTEPELSIAAFDGTDCGEMNGSVDLNVINGSGPYAYTLDTLNNTTGAFETLPAGAYVAYVQDFLDCQDSTDVGIAASDAVVLTAEVTEGLCGNLGAIELSGSFGGDMNQYADIDTNFQSNSVYTELEGGEYIFYIRTAEDCLDTLIIEVPVYGVPEVIVDSSVPAYCEEPVGQLVVSGQEGKGLLSFALDGELSGTATFENLAAGTYTILVTDEAGCTSTSEIEIQATPAISIENLSAEQLFCGDVLSAVNFTPQGGTGNLSYTLTDLSGSEVNEADGLLEGEYRLRIVDEVGCELSEIIVVRKEDCQIYIPTIFDPNSDSNDNVFRLGVPDASDFFIASFQVLDRWGNLVYNKEDIDPLIFAEWWDGTYNGVEVEQGVYVYIIQLEGETQELVKGTLTLIR